jgi:general secretion pathway protein D
MPEVTLRIAAAARPRPTLRLRSLIAAVLLLTGATTAWSAKPTGPMTLNLKDADITAFIGTVSQLTGKNFIVDPRVKGKITVISSSAMNEQQVYQVFLSVLEVHGFAAVPAGSVIKIIPQANARQEAIPTMSEDHPTEQGDEYVTQVLALQNVSAAQLVPILRPLVPQQGHLVAYPPGNILIITDEAANIRRMTDIINRIDVPNSDEIEIIPLQHASATEVVRILTTLEQQRNQERGQPAVPGGGGSLLIADERTNSILMGGDKSDRLRLRAVITQLDTPLEQGGNIHVVYLHYAKAKDMLTVLQGIATTSQQKGKAPAAPPNQEPVSIQADESTNALVISSPPDLFRSLQAVIRQLDVRRAQVYVEATIAEVSQNVARELGVQWAAGNPKNAGTLGVANLATSGGLSIAAAGAAALSGDSTAVSQLPSGLTFGVGKIVSNGIDYAALVRVLAGDTNTNILSTPSLVTMDNEEAEIVVGQNIPIVTGSFTTTGSTGSVNNPFQTINREDVGLTLKVKPQINEGDAVKMDIDQEVSSIAPTPSGVTTADVITNKRSIKTSVLVESGQIIVLGGLIQDDLKQSQQKVPLLGDIPILGYLFRYNSTTKDKTNLMVFIHPVILRDSDTNMRISGGKYNYIRSLLTDLREHDVHLVPKSESPITPPLEDYLSLPPPFNDGSQSPPRPGAAPAPPTGDSGAPQQR